jgi:transmembrane sensor
MSDPAVQQMRLQAAEWVVALAEHPLPDAELVCAHADWCAAHPEHPRTYAEVARLWHAATPEALEGTGLPHSLAQRRGAAALGLALLAAVAWTALQAPPVAALLAYYGADQRTGAGEVRSFTLDDGSTVTLNTRSAVDIDYTAQRRTLRLHQGEVLVQVGKEARPFEVLGRDGAVRALGTRYAVRQEAADTRVTVAESRVQIAPAQNPAHTTPLTAGQSARFNPQQVLAVQEAADLASIRWAQGILVFNDAPLPEVLAELARYRPGLLDVDTQALHPLRFTGVLPVAQPREALALLVQALPIRVTFYTDYLAVVRLEEKN